MPKEEKRVLTLDKLEHGVVISSSRASFSSVGRKRPTSAHSAAPPLPTKLQDFVGAPIYEMRNDLIEEDRSTDIVDEVLLKTIDAPVKKVRTFGDPAKLQDFVGRGRATERASFCPDGAKRAERSLRGRDEAR